MRPAGRFPIWLAAGHDGPDHPCRLVGERDGGDLGRPTREELHEPWSPGSVPLRVSNDSQRSHDQHLSQVAIALLRDPSQSLLAAAGVLSRHEPDPSRQVPARLECPWIGNRRHERAGQYRTHARYLHQSTADIGGASAGSDPAVQLEDLLVHKAELDGEHRDGARASSGKVFSFGSATMASSCARPLRPIGATLPNSPRCPRIAFETWVR